MLLGVMDGLMDEVGDAVLVGDAVHVAVTVNVAVGELGVARTEGLRTGVNAW